MRSLDPFPDLDSQSGSGSRRGKNYLLKLKKVNKFDFLMASVVWMFYGMSR
jgi:hypothetical protein